MFMNVQMEYTNVISMHLALILRVPTVVHVIVVLLVMDLHVQVSLKRICEI